MRIALATAVAALSLAGAAHAQPAEVSVTLGPDLVADKAGLGEREVRQQAAQLVDEVSRALSQSGALQGATVRLVLTELKPNRPTMQQAIDRPGLSIIDSVSIGGAAIEGEVVTADGRRFPVGYDYQSPSIREVQGYSTWRDADRAFDTFARRLAQGRYGA